jgi:hypothetical protein
MNFTFCDATRMQKVKFIPTPSEDGRGKADTREHEAIEDHVRHPELAQDDLAEQKSRRPQAPGRGEREVGEARVSSRKLSGG